VIGLQWTYAEHVSAVRRLSVAWANLRRRPVHTVHRYVLEVAAGAAWNARWLRARIRRRQPGATVVIVNFNGDGLIQWVHAALRRFAPADVRILVVDNRSEDLSRDWLRKRDDIETMFLDRNIGHGPALDLAFHRVRTSIAVALDVDAFPISDAWLHAMVGPLEDERVLVVGPEAWRPYAHPCSLAVRTDDFVRLRLSCRARHFRGRWCDVGEAISVANPGRVHLLPLTQTLGRANLGSVFGDVVYHNCYGTRFLATDDQVLDDGVRHAEVLALWNLAVERYLA
jgi:hypothetical protein